MGDGKGEGSEWKSGGGEEGSSWGDQAPKGDWVSASNLKLSAKAYIAASVIGCSPLRKIII